MWLVIPPTCTTPTAGKETTMIHYAESNLVDQTICGLTNIGYETSCHWGKVTCGECLQSFKKIEKEVNELSIEYEPMCGPEEVTI
jgi:hypothetical protein